MPAGALDDGETCMQSSIGLTVKGGEEEGDNLLASTSEALLKLMPLAPLLRQMV